MSLMRRQMNAKEITGLFDRVYNEKATTEADEKEIKELCQIVFGDGGTTPDPSLLHQFNNLVVKKADEVAKPIVKELVSLFANTTSEKMGNVVQIKLPKRNKARFIWSATGTGVDLIRTEGVTSKIATPREFTAGFYYESLDLVQDSVEGFRALINDVAEAKSRLYLDQINKLIAKAVTSNAIPESQVESGTDITLAQYNKIASRMSRHGGRPIFVADSLLIDAIAMQQTNMDGGMNLLTDKYKDELLRSLNISFIGRTDAVNLANAFTDTAGTETEFPVNEGYMFAGEGKVKPFEIVEFGGLQQISSVDDFETGRIAVKLVQNADIMFLTPERMAYIKDDAITL